MKKIFNSPEIEIMHLGAQDIITTSFLSPNGTEMGEGDDATPDW